MYTTILWDLDNTLLDFTATEKHAFNASMRSAGLTPTDALLALYSEINLAFWKRLERGELTREALLSQRFISFFEAAGITGVDAAQFRDTYQNNLAGVCFYLEDALALCTRLHQTHRQYIVTNGVASTQRSRLRLGHLMEVMDGVFISEELGCEKPAPEFFDICFRQIPGFRKEEAVIVGDSLTSDMLGGNQAGIACCWYNPRNLQAPDTIRIDHTIRTLQELLPIVQTLPKS